MRRREFVKSSLALAAASLAPGLEGAASGPEVALTFDDPTTNGGARLSPAALNDALLEALGRHRLKSVLFVCGKRVASEPGRDLVASWDRAGHLIGNHSFSHLNFNAEPDADGSGGVSLADFEQDLVKNEAILGGHFARLFRFPFFKEGDTKEKRDGMRAFLKARGYGIGRATIDASDWAIDARLRRRLQKDPEADLLPYRDFLLEHILERAEFYDTLARNVLGHGVRHTLLLHHSQLNALFLPDLIGRFLSRGWKVIDADLAYADPVYLRNPEILPAGESLIWALAKETGRFEERLRYPGEDDVYENPRMDSLKL
jgi:peptidoglycan/xylan/chitin deacetylase (PgdA/CDA1 family)